VNANFAPIILLASSCHWLIVGLSEDLLRTIEEAELILLCHSIINGVDLWSEYSNTSKRQGKSKLSISTYSGCLKFQTYVHFIYVPCRVSNQREFIG
jgi:hypothetical protein